MGQIIIGPTVRTHPPL